MRAVWGGGFSAVVLVLLMVVSGVMFGQSKGQDSPTVEQIERGYLSPTAYTNAFFGFKISIPQGIDFQPFLPNGKFGVLFGIQSAQGGITAFTVAVEPPDDTHAASAEEVAHRGKGKVVKTMIGGREFWKNSGTEHKSGDKLWSSSYVTAWDGRVLLFTVVSFNGEVHEKLCHAIESIEYFDPSKAEEIAGPGSSAYPLKTAWADGPTSGIQKLDAGTLTGDIYTNPQLGLKWKVPSGWSHPDDATQKQVIERGHQAAFGDDPAEDSEHLKSVRCTKSLVWLTKYPMVAKSEDNPLVMLTAFDERCAGSQRFPSSLDDKEGLSGITQELRQGMVGTAPPGSKDTQGAFMAGEHVLVEVSGERLVSLPGGTEQKRVFMGLRMMELKGFLLTWFYEAASPQELQQIGKLDMKIGVAGMK